MFERMVDAHCARDEGGFKLHWLVAFHWVRVIGRPWDRLPHLQLTSPPSLDGAPGVEPGAGALAAGGVGGVAAPPSTAKTMVAELW